LLAGELSASFFPGTARVREASTRQGSLTWGPQVKIFSHPLYVQALVVSRQQQSSRDSVMPICRCQVELHSGTPKPSMHLSPAGRVPGHGGCLRGPSQSRQAQYLSAFGRTAPLLVTFTIIKWRNDEKSLPGESARLYWYMEEEEETS
jgi:hypothetical protein